MKALLALPAALLAGTLHAHALSHTAQPGSAVIVELRYGDDASCQSMAEAMQRPVRAVYEALCRIRSVLLECIRRELSKERRQ